MRICFISDTHGRHRDLEINNTWLRTNHVDLIVHCGDFTNWGNPEHLVDFNKWLGELSVLSKDRKLVICGNHDTAVHFEIKHGYKVNFEKDLENATLINEKEVEVEGLTISGIQYSNPRIDEDFWRKFVSRNTDILVTHNALPETSLCNSRMGSHSLKQVVAQIGRDRVDSNLDFLHCFGHVHERHGHEILREEHGSKILCINASNVNHKRDIAYPPILVDCQRKEEQVSFNIAN